MRLIVGLGNPGPDYAETRHNVGQWWLQTIADNHDLSFKLNAKLFGEHAQWQAEQCHLFMPTTYMNESGRALAAICRFYKITPAELLVAHDDIDLLVGDIRLKTGGGHGGHNGLRDIISALGSNQFHRLRIGVGHPGHKDQVHDYVLHRPSKTDKAAIDDALIGANAVLPQILASRWNDAMKQLHTPSLRGGA